MKEIVFSSMEDKTRGLIGMKPIPKNTMFVFKGVRPGTVFHCQGVLEPFEISFHDRDGVQLMARSMTPPHDRVIAPPGTAEVIETAKGGHG